jgi:GT2 family glycosyltransferase
VAPAALLVVLPTLGDRLEFLETTLRSCRDLAGLVTTTLAMVVPTGALQARALGSQYGAVLIDDPGSGMADAVNAGLGARTTEEFYVWVGDDDELVPQGVVALMEALGDRPSAVVAYGHCDYIDGTGSVIGRSKAGHLATPLLPWGPNLIPHPGTIVRLDALEAVGGFDSRLSYALDLDVFLKLRRVGDFITAPLVSARFRWHANSATVADRSSSAREAIIVKNRHLAAWLRPLSWIWNYPVAWASQLAAWAVTVRARNLSA